MKAGPDIAQIAALIGDPARANMLTALMSGKALTATELAAEAGITQQTASTHLAKMHAGGLINWRRQGRHKYVSLSGAEVAGVLEALMGLASTTGHLRTRTGPKDTALRQARVCYNHLAGDRGVQMYDAFVAKGFIQPAEASLILTDAGAAFARDFGIDVDALTRAKAPLCKPCLDWSARRSHLAGSLGRALLTQIEARGWAAREPGSRVVRFTNAGAHSFAQLMAA